MDSEKVGVCVEKYALLSALFFGLSFPGNASAVFGTTLWEQVVRSLVLAGIVFLLFYIIENECL